MEYLVTGGSGYVGSLIVQALREAGHGVVNMDIAADADMCADIGNAAAVEQVFAERGAFDGVFHCAAQLLYKKSRHDSFLRTNVEATRLLAEACVRHGTKQFVYISSNCVYGKVDELHVPEDHPLAPFEIYGQSKAQSEAILLDYADRLNSVILRPPTIIGEGRLGVLSIVYDFIREGRKLWLVGSGENRYQFVYGADLALAALSAIVHPATCVLNIGSDEVPTLKHVFEQLIAAAGTHARVMHLPAVPAKLGMKLCYHLGISPLGSYQYNMITSSFIGDTTAIKETLGWQPSMGNADMLIAGYNYYLAHGVAGGSGHRKAGKGGVLNVIKWLS